MDPQPKACLMFWRLWLSNRFIYRCNTLATFHPPTQPSMIKRPSLILLVCVFPISSCSCVQLSFHVFIVIGTFLHACVCVWLEEFIVIILCGLGERENRISLLSQSKGPWAWIMRPAAEVSIDCYNHPSEGQCSGRSGSSNPSWFFRPVPVTGRGTGMHPAEVVNHCYYLFT